MKKIGVVLVLLIILPICFAQSKVVVENVTESEGMERAEALTTSFSSTEKNYVYGNNLVASVEGDEIKYYHQDIIQSNSIITDSNGEVVYEADYLPFGYVFRVVGENDYGFSNKELDDTGLNYFVARYYDSTIGKFISVDPLMDDNSYGYATNNPKKFIDPSGMENLYPDDPGYRGEMLEWREADPNSPGMRYGESFDKQMRYAMMDDRIDSSERALLDEFFPGWNGFNPADTFEEKYNMIVFDFLYEFTAMFAGVAGVNAKMNPNSRSTPLNQDIAQVLRVYQMINEADMQRVELPYTTGRPDDIKPILSEIYRQLRYMTDEAGKTGDNLNDQYGRIFALGEEMTKVPHVIGVVMTGDLNNGLPPRLTYHIIGSQGWHNSGDPQRFLSRLTIGMYNGNPAFGGQTRLLFNNVAPADALEQLANPTQFMGEMTIGSYWE